jgi:hypothetical protein
MAGDGSALNVLLTANFKRLESDLKKAGIAVEKAVDDMETKFARSRPQLAAGFAGGIAAGAFQEVSRHLGTAFETLRAANKELASFEETARSAGLSLEKFQQLRFAGQKAGVSGADTDKSLTGFARAIEEARRGEGELKKLFDANNLSLNDRNGKAKDFNVLLSEASGLIANAATESDRIDFSKALGVSREFAKALEGGPESLRQAQAEAVTTGQVIDREIIKRAAEFETIWKDAWSGIETRIKAGAVSILGVMQQYAATLGAGSQGAMGKALDYLKEVRSKEGPSWLGDKLIGNLENAITSGEKQAIDAGKKLITELTAKQAATTLKAGIAGAPSEFGGLVPVGGRNPAAAAAYTKRREPAAKAPRGSGGGGGLSDADIRFNQVEDYIAQLEKTGRILQAEKDSIGLSNAERAKAIELARIGTVTDQGQLDRINKLVDANEKVRLAAEKARQAQKGLNDAANFTGEQLLSAFDTLLDGGKIEDAINGITRSLMKAALQAAILGQGPLASLLGMGGTNGAPGGLIGSLLGAFGGARASGGPVQAGKAYLVGENGPEMVRFGKNGNVMPSAVLGGRGGGSAAPVMVNVTNNTPAGVGVQETQGPGGARQIQILVDQALATAAHKNTPGAQAWQNKYGLKRTNGRG